jgi:Ca2+-binding RTX toxin-like protein
VRPLRLTLVVCALAVLLGALAPVGGAKPGDGWHKMRGSRHADALSGTRGRDLIRGLRGHDRINGQRGRDRLHGGRGQDRIYSRDGRRDLVMGGRGADICTADRLDRLRSCELVHRPGGSGRGGPRVLDDDGTGADTQP